MDRALLNKQCLSELMASVFLCLSIIAWTPKLFVNLIQHFGLETEVAQHLSNSYGDCAFEVASLASMSGHRWPVFGRRLVSYYPYIDAEVRYACKREYACTAGKFYV